MAFEIDSMTWDLELPKNVDYKAFEDQILLLTNHRIIPYLDQLDAQLPQYEGVVTIARLEIDLGSVKPGESLTELAYRFEKKFFEAISAQLAALNPQVAVAPGNRPDWTSESAYSASKLIQFLEQGFLTTFSGLQQKPDALGTLMTKSLQAPGTAFVQTLKKLLRRPDVRERIVFQFAPDIRRRLAESINPIHADLFHRTTALLEKDLASRVPATRFEQIRTRLWQTYLELLPEEGSTVWMGRFSESIMRILDAELPDKRPFFEIKQHKPKLKWIPKSSFSDAEARDFSKIDEEKDIQQQDRRQNQAKTERQQQRAKLIPDKPPPDEEDNLKQEESPKKRTPGNRAGSTNLTDVQQELLIQARIIAWLLQGPAEELLARQPFFEHAEAASYIRRDGLRLLSALQNIQSSGLPLSRIERTVLPALLRLPVETLKNVVALMEMQMVGFVATIDIAFQRLIEKEQSPLNASADLFPQIIYTQVIRYFFIRGRQAPFRPPGFLDVLLPALQPVTSLAPATLAGELYAVAKEGLFRNESRFIPLVDLLGIFEKKGQTAFGGRPESADSTLLSAEDLSAETARPPDRSGLPTGADAADGVDTVDESQADFESRTGKAVPPEVISDAVRQFILNWLSFRRVFFLKGTPLRAWPALPFPSQWLPFARRTEPGQLPPEQLRTITDLLQGEQSDSTETSEPAGDTRQSGPPAGYAEPKQTQRERPSTSPPEENPKQGEPESPPPSPPETVQPDVEVTYLRDYTRNVLNFMAESRGLRLPEGMQFTKEALLQAWDQPAADTETPAPATERPQVPETEYPMYKEKESIPVHNAGLVLLNPFLPHFFRRLNMLGDDGRFLGPEQAQRGVLLLEYMATKQTEMPEYMLSLNKLLCGIPLHKPVPAKIEISSEEAELADSMLNAVVNQWDALGKSSPDGLRGAFIIRDGVLRRLDQWKLSVEKKTYDLLLAKMPWSHSVVRLKWMEEMLFVEWG